MMDLVLWRHAQAVDITEAGGDDMARGLTARGQRQAREVGAWLHDHLPKDARVISSPARRALETARGLPREHLIVPSIAPDLGSVDALLAAAGWADDDAASSSRTIVVVGHQPTLGETAARLMCGQPQPWSVKKGAAWWLRRRGRGACELWMVRSPTVS